MTFFSIIIPIYNTNLKFLKKCLESVRNQNYSNYEIIYVDDASDDSEVKNFLSSNTWRVNEKVLKHKKNLGLGEARNTGIRNSNGLYLFFVDSDDWIDKNALKLVQKNIVKNDGYNILKINFQYVYQNFVCKNPKPYDKLTSMTWSLIIKKNFLLDNNIYFNAINTKHEDEYFLLKLLFYNPKILYIDEFLYFYNKTNNNSIMNTTSKSESLFWMNKNLELFLCNIYNADFSNLLSEHIVKYICKMPFYFLREDNNIKLSFFLKNTYYFSRIISLVKKNNKDNRYNNQRILLKMIYSRFFLPIIFLFFKYIYIKLKK